MSQHLVQVPAIGELVKDGQMAEFQGCNGVYLYYEVPMNSGGTLQFPIPLEETKGGYFARTVKAVTLMRWIRKHLDNCRLAAEAETESVE